MQSINSWLAHSSHSNSFKLQRKIINSCDFIWTSRAFDKIEKNLLELTEKGKYPI